MYWLSFSVALFNRRYISILIWVFNITRWWIQSLTHCAPKQRLSTHARNWTHKSLPRAIFMHATNKTRATTSTTARARDHKQTTVHAKRMIQEIITPIDRCSLKWTNRRWRRSRAKGTRRVGAICPGAAAALSSYIEIIPATAEFN